MGAKRPAATSDQPSLIVGFLTGFMVPWAMTTGAPTTKPSQTVPLLSEHGVPGSGINVGGGPRLHGNPVWLLPR